MDNKPQQKPVEESKEAEARTDKLLLRPADVCVKISISRSRCYELIADGVIPAIRLGKSIRVSVRQLEEFVRDLEAEHAVVRRSTEGRG